MNTNYFTTKKLFKHKENRDRFIAHVPIDYELSKRGDREDYDAVNQLSMTVNQKLREAVQKENRKMRLHAHLIDSTNIYNNSSARVALPYNINNSFRHIDEKAYKVLDAPGYSKDLFAHSIDVNNEGLLAALINSQVFLNSTVTAKTQKLVSNLSHINALRFTNRDEMLVIGTADGHMAIYDLNKETSIVVRDYHKSTITSIDFTAMNSIVSVSKDAKARIFDIRTNKQARTFDYLTSNAYTVKSNANNPFLFATSEENGKIGVFDIRLDNPLYYETNHVSPVRALAWNANKRDVLYSADTRAGHLITTNIVTHTQVEKIAIPMGACDLLFSKPTNELLLAQNGDSYAVEVRAGKCLNKIAELRGHTKSVHDLCQFANTNIVSGSGDQSLRFWDLETVSCTYVDKKQDVSKLTRIKTGSSLLLR